MFGEVGRAWHHGIGTHMFSFYRECFHLTLNLFSGHPSSKPDVIAQLEREEKLWMIEIQTQRGRHLGENCRGHFVGNSPSFCLLWVLSSPRSSLRKTLGTCHIGLLLLFKPSTGFPFPSIKPKVLQGPGKPCDVCSFSRLYHSTVFSRHFLVPLALPASPVPHI